MSFRSMILSKKLWLGFGVACMVLLLFCAAGAFLQSGGTMKGTGAELICAAFAAAGLIGTLTAGRGENGAMVRAAVLAAVLIAAICILSLLTGAGVHLGEGNWKRLAFLSAGCFAGGLLCAKRKSGRRQTFTKRGRGISHTRSI